VTPVAALPQAAADGTTPGPEDPTTPAPAAPAHGRRRRVVALASLAIVTALAALAALSLGSVRLSPADVVTALVDPAGADPRTLRVMEAVRVPRTVAALLSGAALAAAGVQMQTVFRNPLADPFVLGVSEGASFGVAVVVIGVGTGATSWLGGLGALGDLGVVGAAVTGAAVTSLVTLGVASRVRGTATVLVVGLMIGAVIAAVSSLIVASADPQRLQQWFAWTRGSFRGVAPDELRIMVPLVLAGLAASLASAKWLNALLLGERYAASMGVRVRAARVVLLLTASLLAGVVTGFAGPIAFIGVAAPHLARPAVGTSDHRTLLPAAALVGATIALVAEVVAQAPGQAGVLPLNAVTALIGAPVVVWVLIGHRGGEVVT
jgi:iron complex transport system permease protein